jgi:hypothetical protein
MVAEGATWLSKERRMPNQHTKKAAETAAKAVTNSSGPAHVLDEAAQTADKVGGQMGNLGLAFGGLAVSAGAAAFALTKFRQLFNG